MTGGAEGSRPRFGWGTEWCDVGGRQQSKCRAETTGMSGSCHCTQQQDTSHGRGHRQR